MDEPPFIFEKSTKIWIKYFPRAIVYLQNNLKYKNNYCWNLGGREFGEWIDSQICVKEQEQSSMISGEAACSQSNHVR